MQTDGLNLIQQGIGYSITQALARFFASPTQARDNTYTWLLAGRHKENVDKASEELRQHLLSEGVDSADIQPVLMDVTDDKSIAAAVNDVKSSFQGLDGTSLVSKERS